MTNKQRWQQAQSSEYEHESHSSLSTEPSWPKRHLSKFDVKLSELADERTLEVGSGTGMIHSFPEEYDAIGIDPLSNMLPLDDSAATVITGAGEHLPFETASIDCVICYNVLDHVLNPQATVEEMKRVLRSDGRLFLTVNVFESPQPLRHLADHIDKPHPHHFSPAELRGIVTDAEFLISEEYVQPHGVNKFKGIKAFAAQTVFGLRQHHLLAVVE